MCCKVISVCVFCVLRAVFISDVVSYALSHIASLGEVFFFNDTATTEIYTE